VWRGKGSIWYANERLEQDDLPRMRSDGDRRRVIGQCLPDTLSRMLDLVQQDMQPNAREQQPRYFADQCSAECCAADCERDVW
jgi:hypothetical protein